MSIRDQDIFEVLLARDDRGRDDVPADWPTRTRPIEIRGQTVAKFKGKPWRKMSRAKLRAYRNLPERRARYERRRQLPEAPSGPLELEARDPAGNVVILEIELRNGAAKIRRRK